MSSHTDSFVASGNSPTTFDERVAITAEPYSVVQGGDYKGQTVNEPPRKKRGRPPKNGIPMTAAERKAASRQNQKQKAQDAERRVIIAAVLRMYPGRLREHELRGIPTGQLRLSLESAPVGTRGRLPRELRATEQTLERAFLAKGRGGRRVRPRGTGPDS